jgi:hypothetical protein
MPLALFRRRERWTFTALGWLFLALAASGLFALVGRYAYPFLAPEERVGGPLLVVEGWIAPEELDAVIELFRHGRYERIVTTGGPVPAWLAQLDYLSHAVLARDYLVRHGLPREAVTAVSAPASAQDRTFLSAVMVREWLESAHMPVERFDLVSVGVHSRRSWVLYRAAFSPRVQVGIIALRPTTYDPEAWWSTSVGVKTVVPEALAWLWTALFFRIAERGTWNEKWGRAGAATSFRVRQAVDAADA